MCSDFSLKDTHREIAREREATAAVELFVLVHITHTKSICAEVEPVAFWVVSASPKFNTTRCSCPHHQLVEVTVTLAVGPLAWVMPVSPWGLLWFGSDFQKHKLAQSGGFRTSTNQSPNIILIFSDFDFRNSPKPFDCVQIFLKTWMYVCIFMYVCAVWYGHHI